MTPEMKFRDPSNLATVDTLSRAVRVLGNSLKMELV